MKIGDRVFPYPVLSQKGSDYKNASFAVRNHAPRLVGDAMHIDMDLDLQCPAVADLIARGVAEYAVHIDCATTSYRELLHQRHPRFRHVIDVEKLAGRVERLALVIATHEIRDYDGDGQLSEDFAGFRFDIPRGGIVAHCSLPVLVVTAPLKAGDAGPPVVVLHKRPETGDVLMSVELNQDSIMIGLGAGEYDSYNRMSADPALQPVLNSMLVLPALIYCLEVLRDGEPDEYREYAWYQTITQSLRTLGLDLETLLLEPDPDLTTVEIAQMLLERPLQTAFAEAARLGADEPEEGES